MLIKEPSPEHEKYLPLLAPYYERLHEQEAFFVESGIPAAKGAADFMTKWIQGWLDASALAPGVPDFTNLFESLTPDVSFVDPTTAYHETHGAAATMAYIKAAYDAIPDWMFYPQDDTLRSMPYWDFYGGQIRCTWPWRMVGRMTSTLRYPNGLTIPALGGVMDVVGIDRYLITSDWQVSRIDSDLDMYSVAQGCLPKLLPALDSRAVRVAGRIGAVMAPALRLAAS